jgi:hypothetical protein
VLERAFRINRLDAWQQYFISSGRDSAGAWSLDGLRLEWAESGGSSGSAAASPAGDSLRLAVSTNSPQALTVRIVPDGAAGPPGHRNRCTCCAGPRRSPSPPPGQCPPPRGTARAGRGVRPRLAARAAPFTLDRAGRPCNAAPAADEIAQQSDPIRRRLRRAVRGVLRRGRRAGRRRGHRGRARPLRPFVRVLRRRTGGGGADPCRPAPPAPPPADRISPPRSSSSPPPSPSTPTKATAPAQGRRSGALANGPSAPGA